MTKMLFLPGAGASASFGRLVSDRLDPDRPRHFFAWPGLGNEPHDPKVRGVDDLVSIVLAELDGPSDLIAQSLGGLVALRVALSAPDKVRRLVLTAASGGLPVRDLGGSDWRDDYRREFPNAVSWITDVNQSREDLSARLTSIDVPTLLIWGDADRSARPLSDRDCISCCRARIFISFAVAVTIWRVRMRRKFQLWWPSTSTSMVSASIRRPPRQCQRQARTGYEDP